MVVGTPLAEDVADQVFQALANATRRDILVRTTRQEQSISALTSRYEMSFAAVQKHVAVLERADLVVKRSHGREQLVQAKPATLRRAAALLDAYEQLWIHRADQITDLLATTSPPAAEPSAARQHRTKRHQAEKRRGGPA